MERQCIFCKKGKLQGSRASGKLFEQCDGCGLVIVDGTPTAPPRGATAEEKVKLGLAVEAKAHPKKKKKSDE